ncbi:MAG: hypothetical protein NTX24_01340 [Candidatus Pacearchaeota archaeon]|nr:hypothetical protein [Candidatus Pacearchaeota archaeon]
MNEKLSEMLGPAAKKVLETLNPDVSIFVVRRISPISGEETVSTHAAYPDERSATIVIDDLQGAQLLEDKFYLLPTTLGRLQASRQYDPGTRSFLDDTDTAVIIKDYLARRLASNNAG